MWALLVPGVMLLTIGGNLVCREARRLRSDGVIAGMTRVMAVVAVVALVAVFLVAVGRLLHMAWLLGLALGLVLHAFVVLVISRHKART